MLFLWLGEIFGGPQQADIFLHAQPKYTFDWLYGNKLDYHSINWDGMFFEYNVDLFIVRNSCIINYLKYYELFPYVMLKALHLNPFNRRTWDLEN